jgi:hypothetical protein
MSEQPNYRTAKVIVSMLTPFIWLGCMALLLLVYIYAGVLWLRDWFTGLSFDHRFAAVYWSIVGTVLTGLLIWAYTYPDSLIPEPNPIPYSPYAVCGGSEWTCNQYKFWSYMIFVQAVLIAGLVVAIVCIWQMVKRVYRYSRWAIMARRLALQHTTVSRLSRLETQSRPTTPP